MKLSFTPKKQTIEVVEAKPDKMVQFGKIIPTDRRIIVISQPRSGGTLLVRLVNQCTDMPMGGDRDPRLMFGLANAIHGAFNYRLLTSEQMRESEERMETHHHAATIESMEHHGFFGCNYITPCHLTSIQASLFASLRLMMGGSKCGAFKTNALFLDDNATNIFIDAVRRLMPHVEFVYLKRHTVDIGNSLVDCRDRWAHLTDDYGLVKQLDSQRTKIEEFCETNKVHIINYEDLVINPEKELAYFGRVDASKIPAIIAKKIK